MERQTAPVAIVMGSQSDWATMRHAAERLDELGVAYEAKIVSAHRTPDRLVGFRQGRARCRLQGDHRRRWRGGASARHGRRHDDLPVLGVPIEIGGAEGRGQPSIPSCRCRPAFRSGTLAIGKPGAVNAGLLAAAILATGGRGAGGAAGGVAAARRRRRWRSVRRMAMPVKLSALPPGSTIGILGGGQLGRMLALAAARLGFKCHIFAPDPESPAFDVAAARTVAPMPTRPLSTPSRAAVDVVTYEFENVDVAAVERLARSCRSGPGRGRWRSARTGSSRSVSPRVSASRRRPSSRWTIVGIARRSAWLARPSRDPEDAPLRL